MSFPLVLRAWLRRPMVTPRETLSRSYLRRVVRSRGFHRRGRQMEFTDKARRGLLQGGVLAAVAAGWSAARAAPAMAVEAKSTGADAKKTFLRQAVLLPANPRRIYEILLDASQFAAATGAPAQID